MTGRILHVVTNVAHYADPDEPTGLWLSELTHAYDLFEAKGYEERIVSAVCRSGWTSVQGPKSLLGETHGQKDRRYADMRSNRGLLRCKRN